MTNPLSWYLNLTCFRPDIISDLLLMLHACTDPKSKFLDFVCRRGIPFTKQSIDISTLWWCFAIGGGKGILGIVLWCSVFILIFLTCIMGICGT